MSRRCHTPKYRIEVSYNNGTRCSFTTWERRCGRANTKNLEAWRVRMNASFQPGGINAHINVHISKAELVNQFTGETVAAVNAPMFETV